MTEPTTEPGDRAPDAAPDAAPDETPVPALTLLPLEGVSCTVDGHCD